LDSFAECHEDNCECDSDADAQEHPVPPENFLPSPSGVVVKLEANANQPHDKKYSEADDRLFKSIYKSITKLISEKHSVSVLSIM
jgi:16S rRNA A1518/A1519 N6-dimethyltransferase RsmA/KsgA/DIM1 with predicted DNA glycosylase/AP lyase activity